MGCFHCDEPNHVISKCPQPINTVKAARKKLDYYARKKAGKHAIHPVLFQLCHQVDQLDSETAEVLHEIAQNDDDQQDLLDEKALFDALVSKLVESDDDDSGPSTEKEVKVPEDFPLRD